MTQEEKQLISKDLCARIPYGLIVDRLGKPKKVIGFKYNKGEILLECINITDETIDPYCANTFYIDEIKPYLRQISTLTEDEKKEYMTFFSGKQPHNSDFSAYPIEYYTVFDYDAKNLIDWLNEHQIDYRNFIDKGLALKAKQKMY